MLRAAAHAGDGQGRDEQARGKPEPDPGRADEAETGQSSEDGLVGGEGESADPRGLIGDLGPVAERVVRAEGDSYALIALAVLARAAIKDLLPRPRRWGPDTADTLAAPHDQELGPVPVSPVEGAMTR